MLIVLWVYSSEKKSFFSQSSRMNQLTKTLHRLLLSSCSLRDRPESQAPDLLFYSIRILQELP